MAISVYIGFFLGFTLQQVDRVGQATLVIQVNNATSLVSPWVYQASQATNDFLPQTLWYAILLVPLLLITKLPFRHQSSILTSALFPFLVAVSWLTLPAATLPASIPQPFLSIFTCGVDKDVNLSVQQIFTFITFYRSFVVSLQTLTIITAVWIFTRFIGISRNILLNIPLIIAPVVSWFAIGWLFPIPGITISPGLAACVIISPVGGGSGSVGGFPPLLETLNYALIRIAFVIWFVSVVNYLNSGSSYAQIHRFLARLKKHQLKPA